jgi:SprT protein
MFNQRVQEVAKKVAECIRLANSLYGNTLPKIKISFDLKGRVAGQAGWRTIDGVKTYYLRFNQTMMMNDGYDHLLNDTVPHEVAHYVCFILYKGCSPHGREWQRVCKQLGGNGERCHNEEIVFAKGKTYEYTASCGTKVRISQTLHKRLQEGQSRRILATNGRFGKDSKYEVVN